MDLEQIQAERLDLGQHAIQCRLVQQAGERLVPVFWAAVLIVVPVRSALSWPSL